MPSYQDYLSQFFGGNGSGAMYPGIPDLSSIFLPTPTPGQIEPKPPPLENPRNPPPSIPWPSPPNPQPLPFPRDFPYPDTGRLQTQPVARAPSTYPPDQYAGPGGVYEQGGVTGGDQVARIKWAIQHPGEPYPSQPVVSAPQGDSWTSLAPQDAWSRAVQASGLSAQQARGNLDKIIGILNQHGVTGWSADSTSNPSADDTIVIPGQGRYDVLTSGNQFWFNPEGGAGGGGGANEFSDPWGSAMERLVNQFIGQATGPRDTRQLDALMASLQAKDQASQQRAQEFAQTLRSRIGELRAPPYTGQQEAAIQAKAYDQLERRRQETLKNARERRYVSGFAPTSGLIAGDERDINRNFEQVRGVIGSDLIRSAIDEEQRRKNQATQLEQIVQQALQGGDLGSLQMEASLAQLENQKQDTGLERLLQAIGATQSPLNLIAQRQQAANQTLGNTGSDQLLNVLMSLFNNQQSGSNNTLQVLGALGPLIGAFL